jgi:hypothetical protein
MLIMSAAHIQQVPSAARAFAGAHYKILKQWADYLVANLPGPGFQNQTDDFAGPIAHSVNLALKGIVAVAAMGQIATAAGNSGYPVGRLPGRPPAHRAGVHLREHDAEPGAVQRPVRHDQR